MKEPQDFMGERLTVGAMICYPVRDTPRGICVSGTSNTGRRINLYNLNNCIVVR